MQGIGALEARQARPAFRAPDLLTALRVPLAAAFVAFPDATTRLAVLAIAGLSDLVDGFWARRVGSSRLGVLLDPICDKIFMGAGFVVVLRSGALEPWEFVGVLLRDIVAVLGFLLVALLRRPAPIPARVGGKVVTVFQLLTLVIFVVRPALVHVMAWVTATISVYAIIDYTRVALRRR